MALVPKFRSLAAAAALGSGSFLALGYSMSASPTSAAPSLSAPTATAAVAPADGKLGFVVSSIAWALGPDADKSNACPNGMTMLAHEAYQASSEGRRRDGESADDYDKRISAAVPIPRRGLPRACEFPEQQGPDPHHRTVVGWNIETYGMDLDGQDSRGARRSSANTCAHEDFRGVNGESGVDNQFYRAVGCTRGFQSNGGKIGFQNEMLTGVWGILISLKGVDSLVSDKDVEVGIYANADPIQLSAARKPLSYSSYNPDQDPRFRADTRGRIVNGVLITDPVNVRFHTTTAGAWMERPVERARLRMTFQKDGSLDGILGGYTNVDELFDFLVGYRTAKDEKGRLSGGRINRALGSSSSAGMTCNGVYHAMRQLADGDRDPKTGRCSSISNQYRIQAIPAFVVEKPSTKLIARGTRHRDPEERREQVQLNGG